MVRIWFREDFDTDAIRRRVQQGYIGNLVRQTEDPDLAYELRPALSAEWRGVTVSTSTDGAGRVATVAAAAGEPALKIAVLGDSTSFGWGVFYESSYPEVLREQLELSLGAPVEVRNFSVPGYTTHQELACFRAKVASWKPDVVVLHYDPNDSDLFDSIAPAFPPPEYGDNLLRSALVKLTRRRWRMAAMRRQPLLGLGRADKYLEVGGGSAYRYAGPAYDAHLEDLASFAREAQSAGLLVVAVVWEPRLTASGDPAATPLFQKVLGPVAAHLRRSGFHVLSLFERYQQLMRDNGWANLQPLWLADNDAHPNPLGHEVIGLWLFEFLMEDPATRELMANTVRTRTQSRVAAADTSAASYRRGLLLAHQGRHEQAAPLFENLLRDHPDDIGVRLNLGRSYRAAGRTAEATVAWRRILAIRPDSVLARLELGIVSAQEGDVAEAKRLLAEAADLTSDKSLQQAATFWLSEISRK